MQYTTVLTHQPGQPWRAVVPALPDCVAEAPTRAEVIEKITECVQDTIQYTEILQLQVQVTPRNGNSESTINQEQEANPDVTSVPLDLMGIFQDDPQWGQIFDEIEQRRNEHLIGG
ncbi:MAG: hypothetical protein DYG89_05370 [Caldilinea sp. CFX5]|nr:hypothetical protein [Caldilinea sp. CFX5]